MVQLLPLIILLGVMNPSSGSFLRDQKFGACFSKKNSRGCQDFVGYITREQCCLYNGFFVRRPHNGQLFLATMLNAHSLPNCENSCGIDFCQGKQCPNDHTCIMRDHDSICTSDCRCTKEQQLSDPVCVQKGPKYRNQCDFHLESCFSNIKQKIIKCSKSGCDKLDCGENKCFLTLQGQSTCVEDSDECDGVAYQPLCGVDNVTYPSKCDLKKAGIARQKEIHIAYKGVCRSSATCSTVECPEAGMSCLKHFRDSSPVCVKCPQTMIECQSREFQSKELFCLSNNFQSRNTCYKDFLACQNNVFIEIVHSGSCLKKVSRLQSL